MEDQPVTEPKCGSPVSDEKQITAHTCRETVLKAITSEFSFQVLINDLLGKCQEASQKKLFEYEVSYEMKCKDPVLHVLILELHLRNFHVATIGSERGTRLLISWNFNEK